MKRSSQLGFSLIELLVVISIVTVLLAVLVPTLSRAREQARRAICAGNMRQWYIGYTNYAVGSKGYYPGVVNLGQSKMADAGFSASYLTNEPELRWTYPSGNSVGEFVDKAITRCPSAPDPNFADKKWNYYSEGTSDQFLYGQTDYSIKAGFASSHTFHNSDGNRVIDLKLEYWNNVPRGVLWYRYKHRYSGFFFNFREENQEKFNPQFFAPQSTYSLMFVDRHRSPMPVSDDGGPYEQTSNHGLPGSLGAEGANGCMKNGAVRWMNMTTIWNSGLANEYLHPQAYGNNGYAEGSVTQFVDEFISSQFP